MANRRWTANEQLKARPDFGSRPSPGVGGTKVAKPRGDSAVPYTGAPGPKGAGYKPARLGFHEVKVRVKQDLADDIYGQEPAIIGPPLPVDQSIPGFTPMPLGGLGPPTLGPLADGGQPISSMPGNVDVGIGRRVLPQPNRMQQLYQRRFGRRGGGSSGRF